MIELVLNRFPLQREEIERRFAQDPVFQQICEDYAEVNRALALLGASPDKSRPQDNETYVNLLRELEEEIVQALEREPGLSEVDRQNGM